jgi:uncharacterized membrane protein YeaQ/YmgE (transglycosylase-associated protein family)
MNKKLFWLSLFLALLSGIIIGLIDTSPNWDDAGITAFLILGSAFLTGAIYHKRAWLWAIIIGGIVFGFNIIKDGNAGSFITVIIALVGAYIGAAVGKAVSPLFGKEQ